MNPREETSRDPLRERAKEWAADLLDGSGERPRDLVHECCIILTYPGAGHWGWAFAEFPTRRQLRDLTGHDKWNKAKKKVLSLSEQNGRRFESIWSDAKARREKGDSLKHIADWLEHELVFLPEDIFRVCRSYAAYEHAMQVPIQRKLGSYIHSEAQSKLCWVLVTHEYW